GGLVAEHKGAGDDGVPDPCLVPPVQVGAADPDRRHPYEFLAWPGGRLLLVGYPQVTGAVQAGRPHARPAVPLLGSESVPGWPGPDPGWVSAPRQGSAGASMLPSESRFVLVPVAAMPTGGGGTCGPFCALAASTPRPFPRFRADPAGPDQRSDPNALSRGSAGSGRWPARAARGHPHRAAAPRGRAPPAAQAPGTSRPLAVRPVPARTGPACPGRPGSRAGQAG